MKTPEVSWVKIVVWANIPGFKTSDILCPTDTIAFADFSDGIDPDSVMKDYRTTLG